MKHIFYMSLYAVLFLLCSTGTVKADELISIVTTTGTVSYSLTDHPVITYRNGDTMVLTTSKVTAEYPIADISEMKFTEGSPTGIRETADGKPLITANENGLTLSGFKVGVNIFVYTTDGSLVRHQKTNASGSASIILGKPGLYVVKVEKSIFKILHK